MGRYGGQRAPLALKHYGLDEDHAGIEAGGQNEKRLDEPRQRHVHAAKGSAVSAVLRLTRK